MKEYDLVVPAKELKENIRRDFPDAKPEEDVRLRIYADYVKLLKEGRKTTTVRFGEGKIRYPVAAELPLVETKPDDKNYEKRIGSVLLEKMTIKLFGELDDNDAMRDGFSRRDELVEALQKIYGKIAGNEPVTIYHIKLFKPNKGV